MILNKKKNILLIFYENSNLMSIIINMKNIKNLSIYKKYKQLRIKRKIY